MTRFSSSRRVALATLLLIGITQALHAQIRYFITDLGTFGGTEGFGYAVNAQGQVTGASLTGGNNGFIAFETAPDRPIIPTDDLGTLGGVQSYGQSINNLGQVAGSAAIVDSQPLHAFRTEPDGHINPATDDLGTLGGTESEAWGINNLGQVVGYSFTTTDDTILHAFRTASNRAINPVTDDLGTLGGTESAAFAINDLGQVTGYASISGGTMLQMLHAFRTAPNRAINPATDDLGTLGGIGSESGGAGINNSGQVTGSSNTSDGSDHAFRTAPNRPINPATDDLGTLGGMESSGAAINNLGQVVGSSATSGFNDNAHAFLFTGGRMYDLNNLIQSDSNWELQDAFGINDAGQIVGIGAHNGIDRPFLLTPARKDLCQKSGWENFGFKNEGQCIQFVETGK